MSEGLNNPATNADVAVLDVAYVGPPDDAFQTSLERANTFLSIRTVPDALTALDGQASIDCLVVAPDADPSAVEAVQAVRDRDYELPVLVVSDGDLDVRAAVEAGATDVVRRDTPAVAELLSRRIEDAVTARRGEREAWETRQAARNELEQSRARFRALIENSPAAITLLDAMGRFGFVSPAVEEIGGYKPEELVGESAFDYVHPEDRERVEREFERAVGSPEYTPTVEYRFRHDDGHWVYVESRGRNRLDDPAVEGFVVNTRDITESKRLENRLRRERDLSERILEVSPQPIVVVDREGTVRLANDRVAEQSGRDTDELLGLSRETPGLSLETLDGEPIPEDRALSARVVSEGETIRDETVVASMPNGDRYRLSMSGAPIESNGRVTHVVLSFDEITPVE